MTATAHALVGGAIATATTHNPALGISLAIVSHPILDMIPHWDFGRGWRDKKKSNFLIEGIFDLLFGLLTSYLLFGIHINLGYFLLVVLASLFFDFIQIPYWFLGWKFAPFSWAYQFGSKLNGRARLPWGIFNQVVAVAIVILLSQYIGQI